MAEVQLNKPLYKSTSGDGTPAAGPALPRHPRPSLMPRMGAILLDVLLMHFILLLIVKFAPKFAIRLGAAGEWFGLAVAWVYFTVCGSHLAWGRTLGKLTMRLQVCDVAGPDLPFGRAAIRASLLLVGCVFWIVLDQYGRHLGEKTEFSAVPTFVQQIGWAINWGWLLGNMLFSMYEPFGRTLYDKVAGSVVTTTDSEPQMLQDFLTDVRTTIYPTPRRAWFAFAAVPGILFTFVITLYIMGSQAVSKLSQSQLEEITRTRDALHLPGFSRPISSGQLEPASGTGTTSGSEVMHSVFTFEHLGPIDVDQLKKNEVAMSAPDRILHYTQSEPKVQG